MSFPKGLQVVEDLDVVVALRGEGEIKQVVVPYAIGVAEKEIVERIEGFGILGDDVAEGFVFGPNDVGGQHDDDFTLVPDDVIRVTISGIGTLENTVAMV